MTLEKRGREVRLNYAQGHPLGYTCLSRCQCLGTRDAGPSNAGKSIYTGVDASDLEFDRSASAE